MSDATQATSQLDALSDEEFDARVDETIKLLMEEIDGLIFVDDPVEAELRQIAAATALRNTLGLVVASDCLGEPRPIRLVKERIRDLEIERVALSILKVMQSAELPDAVDES
jgi:hypothetical protein